MEARPSWYDAQEKEECFLYVVHTSIVRRHSGQMSTSGALMLAIVLMASVARSTSAEEFGSLRLCPAGGRSFMMAWNLACEMKRKKRSAPGVQEAVLGIATPPSATSAGTTTTDNEAASAVSNRLEEAVIMKKRTAPDGYRPATLSEIMRICCDVGCEVRDLLAYCDPFGPWNS